MYQTSRKLKLLWLSCIECHQRHLNWVKIFICSSPHGCTLLIIEVAIYSILGSLCYLFHTNSLSLCVLFYHEYEKGKTNLICRELMHMPCTQLLIKVTSKHLTIKLSKFWKNCLLCLGFSSCLSNWLCLYLQPCLYLSNRRTH